MYGSDVRKESQLQILGKKCTDLYLQLRNNEPNPPQRLFHYTDSQGLLGIAAGQKLWASRADSLNDSSEPQYAIDVLRRSLEDTERSLEPDSLAAQSLRGFWEYLADEYRKHGPDIYVSCFSEKRDLLSQWRAYGDHCAGYAIGFSGPGLCNLLDRGEGQHMMKIVYNEQEQRQEARRTWEEIISIANGVKTPLVDAETGAIRERLRSTFFAESIRLRAKFKTAAFKEEEEWRIVQFVPSGSEVKFRAAAEAIKPYLELDVGRPPIEEVTIGPTLDTSLSSRSLGLLLTKCGYSNVCLKKSSVPYRQ